MHFHFFFVILEEEKQEEEEEWTPYIPEEPSAILTGLHSKEEGKFWLSMVSSVETAAKRATIETYIQLLQNLQLDLIRFISIKRVSSFCSK